MRPAWRDKAGEEMRWARVTERNPTTGCGDAHVPKGSESLHRSQAIPAHPSHDAI